MTGKILCKIGFHDWKHYRYNYGQRRKCARCGLKQYLTKEISSDMLGEDDVWRKL